jgi:hypothetical protein
MSGPRTPSPLPLCPPAVSWVPGKCVPFVAVHDGQPINGTMVLPTCMTPGEFQNPFSLHPHLPLTDDKNHNASHGMLATAIVSGFDEDFFSGHAAFQAEYVDVLRYAEKYFRTAHVGAVCCFATDAQPDKLETHEARKKLRLE